jgi:hypothetical protein
MASPAIHAHSNDSIGSAPIAKFHQNEAAHEDFEEQAAILEFEAGMERTAAEQLAWMLVARNHRLQ